MKPFLALVSLGVVVGHQMIIDGDTRRVTKRVCIEHAEHYVWQQDRVNKYCKKTLQYLSDGTTYIHHVN